MYHLELTWIYTSHSSKREYSIFGKYLINIERNKILYVVFIDPKKPYNRVPTKIIWRILIQKNVHDGFINIKKICMKGLF